MEPVWVYADVPSADRQAGMSTMHPNFGHSIWPAEIPKVVVRSFGVATSAFGWEAVIATAGLPTDIGAAMRPYWITTTKPMTLGYGITAHSTEDAETLLRMVLPGEYAVNTITRVRDVQSLDQRHVVPNMGDLLKRGIWFPRNDHLTG